MTYPDFNVIVTIENKPFINDPEGETIFRDLILKNNYKSIKSVRTAKVLKLIVSANNPRKAVEKVRKMCEDLRIYNSLVSNCQVNVINEKEKTDWIYEEKIIDGRCWIIELSLYYRVMRKSFI